MSIQLPPGANLEHLKNQAKRLRGAVASGDAAALKRVAAVPEAADAISARKLSAARALLVIAREYGFTSWPRLKEAVEAQPASSDPIEAFLRSACGGRLGEARELLRSAIDAIRGDPYAAAAAGEGEAVETHLARDPEIAKHRGGPMQRTPLLYLCWSNLASDARRRPGFLRAARALLKAGADPDARITDAPENHPKSALYGALGFTELMRLLLDAGADPNDGESLYHACEQADLSSLALLLEHPRIDRASVSYCLTHMLDRESDEGVRMFIAAGADVSTPRDSNGENALLKAVRRPGRSLETVRMLLAAGADPRARTPAGASAYALARRAGNLEIAELVRLPGVDEELPPSELFLAACGAGDARGAKAIVTANPGLLERLSPTEIGDLHFAAWHGRHATVRAALDAGLPIGCRNEHGATFLHSAAFRADLPLVDELLTRGAPLDVRDADYSGTPLDWVCAGSLNPDHSDNRADADHAAIAERLIAAGSPLLERGWGSDEVLAALKRHGVP
jgi:ankyrin repeat protein